VASLIRASAPRSCHLKPSQTLNPGIALQFVRLLVEHSIAVNYSVISGWGWLPSVESYRVNCFIINASIHSFGRHSKNEENNHLP
jgi:hypothetical protein